MGNILQGVSAARLLLLRGQTRDKSVGEDYCLCQKIQALWGQEKTVRIGRGTVEEVEDPS